MKRPARPASSFLSIVMYSDEHGETIVEGNEEDVTYDDEAIFEMDDLPSKSYQHHSPEISSARYYAPTHVESQGLSQSVFVNKHHYLVSNILHKRSPNYYHIQDSKYGSERSQIIYSQSAPTPACMSDYPDFSAHHDIHDNRYSLDSKECFIEYYKNSGPPTCSPTKEPNSESDTKNSRRDPVAHPIDITPSGPVEGIHPTTNPAATISSSIKELNAYLSLRYNDSLPSPDTDFMGPLIQVPRFESRVVDYRVPSGVFENSYSAWSALATKHYETNSYFKYPTNEFQSEINRQWEFLHYDADSLKKVTNNPFIFESIIRNGFAIKVTGIENKRIGYKHLIRHFHSCNVVFIRYFPIHRCAYIGYRNYDAMIEAIEKFDRTVMNGLTIYCRPSDIGELTKDDESYVKLLSQSSYPLQRKNFNKIDTFVPERYGIQQTIKSYRFAKPVDIYDTRSSNSATHNRTILSVYHPKAITTMLPVENVRVNYQHRHFLDNIYPFIAPSSDCYIIMKPWSHKDVYLSQEIDYWSLYPQNATIVNYLFNSTPEVNFIFSIAGSKTYHGHAIMKSEVMDIQSLKESSLIGTPFHGINKKFFIALSNRSWRFVCKIEWMNKSTTKSQLVSRYLNPWFHNHHINRLGECTIIEPTVGRQLVNTISNH